nr:hypothetical protein [Polymorphobacter sp.]
MIEAIAAAGREVWTRRSVVRGHIDSSIYLLFDEAEKSSVNLLVAAATDVLRGVLVAEEKVSVADSILATVPADQRKSVIDLFKSPYYFAKHARKDPHEDIEIFISFCDFSIFLAISDYKIAYQKWSLRMLIFAYWFRARHAAWLENYKGDLELHSVGWFDSDSSFGRAKSIIKHFDANPDEVKKIMADLNQNWIELP